MHCARLRLTTLLLLTPVTLAAQATASTDPIINRIWSLGMDSSLTPRLAQTLFDSIGPRLTGTAGQQQGKRLAGPTVRVVGNQREERADRHNGTGTLVMMEAMRILKLVLPHPSRTIVVGHWTSEENGLVGSRAFTEDHPEVLSGLQALFNQDNGTGRVVRVGAAGLPDAGVKLQAWLQQIPELYRKQITLSNPGFPSGGGSDDASFACHGLPALGLGAPPGSTATTPGTPTATATTRSSLMISARTPH